MSRLAGFRRRKDEFFRTHEQSPLDPEQKEQFTGLVYYPERPDLRFEVTLDREAVDPTPIKLQTTTGEPKEFIPAGKAHLTIEGQEVSLTVYREVGRGRYFLPFRDATAGTETYPVCRYLDPQETPKGTIIIDFNYAYNPYCAYSTRYSCPLPPADNIVNVPIRAGEKIYPEP